MIPLFPLVPWPWFPWRDRNARRDRPPGPLREFVYLDEVSLRSLLSSQTGEIKETVSEHTESALVRELNLKLAGDIPFAAKGEGGARFQTSNSSTLQTSRKATVQSWFRDLHDRAELRLISPVNSVKPVDTVVDLMALNDSSIATAGSSLARGTMIEFRVKLAAHPVFHLTTMMTEFAGVTEDFGDLLPKEALNSFQQIQPMVKVLQRLMAGLIPILAEALDHVVVKIAEVDYVVHREAIAGLGFVERPLILVGVTEQEAYWKDIRRVLFSGAAFTMLCRIARPGLHEDWTPVKLVDVFGKVAPDFPEQISAAWRLPFEAVERVAPEPGPATVGPLELALVHYGQALLNSSRRRRSDESLAEIHARMVLAIDALKDRVGSVADQKGAFVALRIILEHAANVRVSADKDLRLREAARAAAGLSFFPGLASSTSTQTAIPPSVPERVVSYLDTEVIAIYW